VKLSETIDRVRGGIVQIRKVTAGNDLGDPIGTGFLVGLKPYRAVTAKHVTDAIGAGQGLHIAFAGPSVRTPELMIEAAFVGAPARVVDTDEENDLALLELLDPNFSLEGFQVGPAQIPFDPHGFVVASEVPREGDALAVSGYPLSQPSLVTNAGILASAFSPDGTPGKWADRLLGDFTANPGNSGGPVYECATGQLIGVCVAGRLAPVVAGQGMVAAGLTVIVPVSKVNELLVKNGVELPAQTSQRAVPPAKRSRNARRR
jgi:S1-C subfamily serine protease